MSTSFFNRLLRLMTRRYRSFRSEVAKRPPSRGTQVGRDDGDHVEHHPLGAIRRLAEGLDGLQALEQVLLALRARLGLDAGAHVARQRVHVDLGQHLLDGGGAHLRIEVAAFILQVDVLFLGDQLVLLQVGVARIHHHVGFVVDDPLEVAHRHAEQRADGRRQALEEPDVHDRNGQLDVAHALATHLGMRHFHAAAVANDAAVTDALVLAAGAFPVLHGSEDPFAEQAVLLRLEGAIVDGFGLGDLAVRPAADDVGGGQLDADAVLRLRGSFVLTHFKRLVHDFSFSLGFRPVLLQAAAASRRGKAPAFP
jgi:hypothetical protein